jgi:flagellar basal body rod protein FlgC
MKKTNKLSWEDTYKSMAEEKEDWDDFDVTLIDGLDVEKVREGEWTRHVEYQPMMENADEKAVQRDGYVGYG